MSNPLDAIPHPLDAIPHHEACSMYPHDAVVSAQYNIQIEHGELSIRMVDGAAFLFENKLDLLEGQGIGDILFDLVEFRKTGEFVLLNKNQILTDKQKDIIQNITSSSNKIVRLSGGVIDTYLDRQGNRFLIATMRDGGSGMGSENKITTSAGGMYGEDIIGGCVKEMAEECPIIVKGPDGILRLGIPNIQGQETTILQGLKDGIHEFLKDKIGTFIQNIEKDTAKQIEFKENFGIDYNNLEDFLRGSLKNLKDNIVWLDTRPDDIYANTNVNIIDSQGKTTTHRLWMNDEKESTRSIELRIPVIVTLPEGYVFAGNKPKLYLESTRQEPTIVSYEECTGIVYDRVKVGPVDTLLAIQKNMLLHSVLASTQRKTTEIMEKNRIK